MPLDAQADLPDRCYSYLLQETMDYLCIRDSFDESKATLEKVLGIKISSSRKWSARIPVPVIINFMSKNPRLLRRAKESFKW